MKIWVCMLAVILVAICLAPATANTFVGNFSVDVGGSSSDWNSLISGSGDGYREVTGAGPWFFYPQASIISDPWGRQENLPRWWNQWFYDGVYDPSRRKVVDLSFIYRRIDPVDFGFGSITINWSTPGWSQLGQDSPPMVDIGNDGTVYVERYTLSEILKIEDDITHNYSAQSIWLPMPYNPEWVSIDVRGYNFSITNGVMVHQCVPEPGSLLGLGSALVCFFGLKLRRR